MNQRFKYKVTFYSLRLTMDKNLKLCFRWYRVGYTHFRLKSHAIKGVKDLLKRDYKVSITEI